MPKSKWWHWPVTWFAWCVVMPIVLWFEERRYQKRQLEKFDAEE
jgi:predicted negative regulator of RcsB-dependent stress response